MQCSYCGTNVPFGVLICPSCGNEIAGQPSGTHGEDITADTSGYSVDRTVGGAPTDRSRDELTQMRGFARETFEGHPGDVTAQGPRGDMTPSVSTYAPEAATVGQGGPPSWGRWVGGVVVIVVVVTVLGLLLVLFGDVGEENGGGDGGGSDLAIVRNMTTAMYIYEPPGAYSFVVVIKNDGATNQSLDGHDIEAAVITGTGLVAGFDSYDLTGTLEPGDTRTVWLNVQTGLSGASESVTFRVRLESDGGSKTLDEYRFTSEV